MADISWEIMVYSTVGKSYTLSFPRLFSFDQTLLLGFPKLSQPWWIWAFHFFFSCDLTCTWGPKLSSDLLRKLLSTRSPCRTLKIWRFTADS